MKLCMLCGTPTEGSIGAAGIKWSFICQPCKDEEDKAALASVEAINKSIKSIFELALDGRTIDARGEQE